MYTKIFNPVTNTYVDIYSKQGNNLILKYLNYLKCNKLKLNNKNILKGGNSNVQETKDINMENKFTNIYQKNIWGSSGTGSKFTPDNKWFITELRNNIETYKIKKIADLGCGDWEIMKHFNFKDNEKYFGIDCVEFLVNKLNNKYSNHNIKFIHQDISNNIPSGYDIVILKDVIQHWTDEDINKIFSKILQNNKYVYSINGYKFTRDPSKNNWTKRELDKKYSYHPIDINKYPLNQFNDKVIDIKKRRSKEYILFKN